MTTNEAAERLAEWLHEHRFGCLFSMSEPGTCMTNHVPDAERLMPRLAVERRATVERIRERLAVAAGEAVIARPTGGTDRERQAWANGLNEYAEDVRAILDEEAAR